MSPSHSFGRPKLMLFEGMSPLRPQLFQFSLSAKRGDRFKWPLLPTGRIRSKAERLRVAVGISRSLGTSADFETQSGSIDRKRRLNRSRACSHKLPPLSRKQLQKISGLSPGRPRNGIRAPSLRRARGMPNGSASRPAIGRRWRPVCRSVHTSSYREATARLGSSRVKGATDW